MGKREERITNGLERGELKGELGCGCVIIQDRTADAYIVFCHKHEAAPLLYEALKAVMTQKQDLLVAGKGGSVTEKWEIKKLPVTGGIAIYAGDDFIAGGLSEEDANFIVTSRNACTEINPDFPKAVAESIRDLYQACEWSVEDFESDGLQGSLKVTTRTALLNVLAKARRLLRCSIGEPLANYDCGCAVHKDNHGFYVINWCPLHKATDDLHGALKFFVAQIEPW